MLPSSYETSNIYLASFLRNQGARLLRFERVGKRRIHFYFAADEKLHDLVRWYWSGTPAPIVPLALFGSLRRLKCLVRNRPENAAVKTTLVLSASDLLTARQEENAAPTGDAFPAQPCPPTC